MKGLFVIAHSYYEEYSPYYFEGPETATKEDFEKACQSLLEQAGYNAILMEQKDAHPSFIGWNSVVESMIPLLEQQGYRHFKPPIVRYWGGIIDSYEDAKKLGNAGREVVSHNKRVREDVFERHKK